MNITDITIDEIQKFVQKIVNHLYVKILIYGEISKGLAAKIGKCVENDVQTVSNISMRREVLPHREINLECSK